MTDFGLEDLSGTSAPGGHVLGVSGLLGPLGRLLEVYVRAQRPPDPSEALRLRLLSLQLAERLGTMQAYGLVPWSECLDAVRSDHLIIGRRGGGKTAFGVLLAQRLAGLLEQPLRTLGLRKDWAAAVGGEPVRMVEARDCVVLVDEAGLRLGQDVWESLALARHRGVSWVYTSQSTAALPRDVLRLEAQWWAKEVDVRASLFEREELRDLMAGIVAIQSHAGFAERRDLVLRVGPPGVVTSVPLPSCWSDEMSRLHR